MAAQEIDRISDPSATEEERQVRKRRLIKGPKEFREIRKKSREIDSDGPIFSQWGSSHSPNREPRPIPKGGVSGTLKAISYRRIVYEGST
jgi:hypothetical protein